MASVRPRRGTVNFPRSGRVRLPPVRDWKEVDRDFRSAGHAIYMLLRAMFYRRATCPVLLLFLCTGCATSFELKNPMPKRQLNEARLAAAEAVSDYPKDAEPKDIAITAV